ISKCTPSFTLESRLTTCYEYIQQCVEPTSTLITLVSGGIDSTVCALLINKALPNHTKFFFFIDNGFSRKNEGINVKQNLKEMGIDVHSTLYSALSLVIDAKLDFLNGTTFIAPCFDAKEIYEEVGPLRLIFNPEHKRSIIGDMFMTVVENTAEELGINFDQCILVQGNLICIHPRYFKARFN
ncbi:hypothetical protein MXB_3515, partial [Myxobolus squamalis]